MIISKEIIIKDKKGNEKIIKIKDLSKGSNRKIKAKCSYCGKIKEISYKEYNRNIKNTNKFSCSYKCGVLKRKETNLKKYGVEHTFQSDEIKEKIKETFEKKYGVDHVSKIKEVSEKKKSKKLNDEEKNKIKDSHLNRSDEEIKISNEKRKETNLKKYDVDNISKLEDIKNKKKETFEKKYGGFTLKSKTLKEKVDKTLIKEYGTTNIMSLDFIKNKIKETNLEKYGVEYPQQNEEIKTKIKNTMLERYGVDNIMFSEDFKTTNLIIGKDEKYIKYLGGRINLFQCDCGKKHQFEIDTDNYFKRKQSNNKLCTKCYPINENVSIKEKELYKYIRNIYNGEIIENYRDGLEIDIYLPKLNIGFEFNGLYWHSDKFSKKERHLEKLNYFKERNIKIYYIWEDDWDFKTDIIKSQIKNRLKLNDIKIYARKCDIKIITDIKLVRNFINNNHLQGFIGSKLKLGLFNKNELVSLITFDKNEGRKKMSDDDWNLSRFCSKLNTNVIGGFSKLLSFFIKTYKPKRIITYADKEWSDGNLYIKNNFNNINETKVNYKYLINNRRINKQRYTKKKLKINISESQYMKNKNIYRIYDCGQIKFELLI